MTVSIDSHRPNEIELSSRHGKHFRSTADPPRDIAIYDTRSDAADALEAGGKSSSSARMFTQLPLCWAHLIRQAIQLARHDKHPAHPKYATFLDRLCEIYHQALRHPRDGRRSVGRAAQAAQLLDQLRPLCTRQGERILAYETPAHLAGFLRLQNQLLANPDCLFVFVEQPAVEATNNRSERNVRREAEIRQGARTSKSAAGPTAADRAFRVAAGAHHARV